MPQCNINTYIEKIICFRFYNKSESSVHEVTEEYIAGAAWVGQQFGFEQIRSTIIENRCRAEKTLIAVPREAEQVSILAELADLHEMLYNELSCDRNFIKLFQQNTDAGTTETLFLSTPDLSHIIPAKDESDRAFFYWQQQNHMAFRSPATLKGYTLEKIVLALEEKNIAFEQHSFYKGEIRLEAFQLGPYRTITVIAHPFRSQENRNE